MVSPMEEWNERNHALLASRGGSCLPYGMGKWSDGGRGSEWMEVRFAQRGDTAGVFVQSFGRAGWEGWMGDPFRLPRGFARILDNRHSGYRRQVLSIPRVQESRQCAG